MGGGGDPGGYGIDPGALDQLPGAPGGAGGLDGAPDPDEKLVGFVSFVLDDVQGFWSRDFARAGQRWEDARLVLFRRATSTGCGPASSATGPFYCPADRRVYLDLGFFRELRDRFGAPGDFAQAYVLAHEIGHHVQHLLGIDGRVRQLQASQPEDANRLSVRLELQADCLAGVWAHSTYERGLLEPGDLEEGLRAAASVGDDRLQAAGGGPVSRESFTHGSAQQRTTWFRAGYDSGDADRCDTFTPVEV